MLTPALLSGQGHMKFCPWQCRLSTGQDGFLYSREEEEEGEEKRSLFFSAAPQRTDDSIAAPETANDG